MTLPSVSLKQAKLIDLLAYCLLLHDKLFIYIYMYVYMYIYKSIYMYMCIYVCIYYLIA